MTSPSCIDKTRQAVDAALATNDPRLRATARTVLAQMNPNDAKTIAALNSALSADSIIEQQGALYALGLLKSKESSILLNEWADIIPATFEIHALIDPEAARGFLGEQSRG